MGERPGFNPEASGHLERHQNTFGQDTAELEHGGQVQVQKARESATVGTGLKIDSDAPDFANDETNADTDREARLGDQLEQSHITKETVAALEAALLALGLDKNDFQITSKESGKAGMDARQIGNAVGAGVGMIDCVVPTSRLQEIKDRLVTGVDMGVGSQRENFNDLKGNVANVDAMSEVGQGETLTRTGKNGETVYIRLWAGKEQQMAA